MGEIYFLLMTVLLAASLGAVAQPMVFYTKFTSTISMAFTNVHLGKRGLKPRHCLPYKSMSSTGQMF